jgi:uncharacterized protein
MGERLVAAALALSLLGAGATAGADEPRIPAPQGFVTDVANVIPPATEARLKGLLEELRAKTGAEIAVLTVPSTKPLDDFTYAMKVADAWRPGRKRDDTGIVFLVAVNDRKLRILTGYGLEGILPDGLVGEIQDEEIVPAFRAGRMDEGIERGVRALAARIAAAHDLTLTGVPPPRPRAARQQNPWLTGLLLVGGLVFILFVLYGASHQQPGRFRRGRRVPPIFFPGPFGGGGGGGGWGGGGGGFDGFGGGGFGGGGAGRSW